MGPHTLVIPEHVHQLVMKDPPQSEPPSTTKRETP